MGRGEGGQTGNCWLAERALRVCRKIDSCTTMKVISGTSRFWEGEGIQFSFDSARAFLNVDVFIVIVVAIAFVVRHVFWVDDRIGKVSESRVDVMIEMRSGVVARGRDAAAGVASGRQWRGAADAAAAFEIELFLFLFSVLSLF